MPVLLALAPAAGCAPETAIELGGASREIASWEFSPEGQVDRLVLWPMNGAAPERKRRHLTTLNAEGRLSALVDGPDPCFAWKFETPVRASSFRVEVESAEPGPLQLYWATRECPTFSETCSASQTVPAGRSLTAFFLDPAAPIREFRLDLPEKPGARLSFLSIAFDRGTTLDTAWTGPTAEAAAEVTPNGLRLTASAADPWVFTSTPGLEASWVTSVDIVLHGPERAPQLFWDGPCGHFAEACSVMFKTADAGSTTHWADLRQAPKWTGRIRTLRLDPGPSPGVYWIERVSLNRDPGP